MSKKAPDPKDFDSPADFETAQNEYLRESGTKMDQDREDFDEEKHQQSINYELLNSVGSLPEEHGIYCNDVKDVEYNPGGISIDLFNGDTYSLMLIKCEE